MKAKSDSSVAERRAELDKALSCIDWQQVVMNGGPPYFFVEGGRFCLRAERWAGHPIYHRHVSLADLITGRMAA
jgi:hypothetical protein